jgi:molecular chaperone DnaK (HSP70)
MATQWALDLGTTNSVVAKAEGGDVRVVSLPSLGRALPTDQSPLIPSTVHVSEVSERFLWFFKLKRQEVLIGQRALDRNYDGRSPSFAQSFKRYLGHQSHRVALRSGDADITIRECTRLYLRELLKAMQEYSGDKITDLTIPAPVGYFEHYRAELQALARSLGVQRFRSLDEPVAAGLGYGVNIAREENLLVVDFGGGTLNLGVVRLGPEVAQTGGAPVLAKHMVNMGGDDVDRWLMEHFVPAELMDLPEYQCDLRWQVMQLKEHVSRSGRGEMRWRGLNYELDRAELVRVLTERGMYEQLRTALDDIRRQLESTGARVDEVLIVGGSTQLPEVPAVVDSAFPEAVVRHDQEYVFTSVALGAARYAGGVDVDDFVYHDYAIALQNDRSHSVEYELLVPRRTRYPTAQDFAVRYYADYPGMTELRVSVCEVGRLGQAPVAWEGRPNGNRYWSPQTPDERSLVVELNPADQPLLLRPVGVGTSPRLRVTYSVNADRWLIITVEDLVAKRTLRDHDAVVRLR